MLEGCGGVCNDWSLARGDISGITVADAIMRGGEPFPLVWMLVPRQCSSTNPLAKSKCASKRLYSVSEHHAIYGLYSRRSRSNSPCSCPLFSAALKIRAFSRHSLVLAWKIVKLMLENRVIWYAVHIFAGPKHPNRRKK
jgi:hypothetical protein